jgi:hypothetical protein
MMYGFGIRDCDTSNVGFLTFLWTLQLPSSGLMALEGVLVALALGSARDEAVIG